MRGRNHDLDLLAESEAEILSGLRVHWVQQSDRDSLGIEIDRKRPVKARHWSWNYGQELIGRDEFRKVHQVRPKLLGDNPPHVLPRLHDLKVRKDIAHILPAGIDLVKHVFREGIVDHSPGYEDVQDVAVIH